MGHLAQSEGVHCSAKQPIFAKDDRIIVVEGDMVNLTGRVERLGDDGLVYVRGDLEEMRNAAAVPFKAAQLSKYFAVSRTGCGLAAADRLLQAFWSGKPLQGRPALLVPLRRLHVAPHRLAWPKYFEQKRLR